MKRLLSISLLAVACAALVSPEPAFAGKWKEKREKKKKAKKNKGNNGNNNNGGGGLGHGWNNDDDDDDGHGHGNHSDDDDGHGHGGGGGGGGGGGPKSVLRGAGQKGVQTFGGKIVKDNFGTRGIFILDIHPIAPSVGPDLSVACRFTKFTNVSFAGNRVEFRAAGGCRHLNMDGTITITENTSDFQIVDNPGGDAIRADFVGEGGVSIPQGQLEFGDLIVTPAS